MSDGKIVVKDEVYESIQKYETIQAFMDDMERLYLLPLRSDFEKKEFLYSDETFSFFKYTASNKIAVCKNTDEPDIIALHSGDIWMPIVFIATEVLLPLAINIIYDFLKFKIGKKKKSNQKARIEIIVQNGKKIKSIKYDGPAETFKETFDDFDFNKFWEQ